MTRGRPVLPDGSRYTTKDEQDADRRRMEKDFGIERDAHGRRLGTATGKPVELLTTKASAPSM